MKNEKHIPFYTVLEALSKESCPICYLVQNSVDKYFNVLLYEGINDIDFRKNFDKNKGFCNFHAYKILNYHDGLAVAIIYREVLREYIEEILTEKHTNKNNFRSCVVCSLVTEKEEQYISIVAEYSNDEEFKRGFEDSHGLCLLHYFALLKKNINMPDWLKRFHIKKYKDLLNTIDKFIDSNNAALGENRPQLTAKEELCWIEIVKTIVGFEGKNILLK